MREAVVILPPDMARQQIVQRRDRLPPRQSARDLQPLGVLVEHRIDDVRKRLVGIEQTVASGQQVALEPSLALVLAQNLEHAAVRREPLVVGLPSPLPTASRRLEYRVEAVRRRSRPDRRCGNCAAPDSTPTTSRRKRPSTRVSSASAAPGVVDRHGVVRKSGISQVAQEADRRWRAGWRPCGDRPAGASAASSRRRVPRSSNNSSGR